MLKLKAYKKQNIYLFLILVFLFVANTLSAQKNKLIHWGSPVLETKSDLSISKKVFFEGAFYPHEDSLVPYFVFVDYYSLPIQSAKVEFSNVKLIDLTVEESKLIGSRANFSSSVKADLEYKSSGNKNFIQFKLIPFVVFDGQIKKIVSFDYLLIPVFKENIIGSQLKTGAVSALNSGAWYKIAVTNTGIHRISKSFFATAGINIDGVDPKKIRIFGNGTGMLPEENSVVIQETLAEMSIYVEGESDGVFNDNDFIQFYAVGPHVWEFNKSSNFFDQKFHLYTDTAYYFINFDQTNGKRIQSQSQSTDEVTHVINEFVDCQSHQVDQTNLIHSGRKWLGEYFDITTSYDFSFSFPNIISSVPVKFKSNAVVKSLVSSGNNFTYKVNGNLLKAFSNISAVSNFYTAQYVQTLSLWDSALVSGSLINVNLSYQKPEASSVAWLDFITLNALRSLSFSNGQMSFRSSKSVGLGNVSQFNISNSSALVNVWDVSDPLNVKKQELNFSIGTSVFVLATDSLKEFVAFDNTSNFTPIYIGGVNNQNILSNVNKEYILVCPPSFFNESKVLSDFHESFSGLTTAIVTTQQIYNEFSSGAQDITAIRNYMRYLYNNSTTKPKYLMLMGDASYDFKYRISGNTNFVPTFQSEDSYQPLSTFASDDYYGMIDDVNSIYSSSSTVDIGIGRFPAKTNSEVSDFVNKVKSYVQSTNQQSIQNSVSTPFIKSTFGDWKNSMMFVADDGNTDDGFTNAHLDQTEMIVESIETIDSTYNIKKIYLDAYAKVSSAEGGKYPDVDQEINLGIDKGAFIVSYIGHGGEAGWADERILEISDIVNWDNIDRLPLFITATCEFSRYDNPDRISAGEYVILNNKGGAIGMLTTVRLVFGGISNNIGFSINFLKNLLPGNNVNFNSLGDAVRLAKIESPIGSNYNNRKFTLLGDPAVTLTTPIYRVKTNSIIDVDGNQIDTINALSKVKITGQVIDRSGNLISDYNGIVFPTVYDKYKKSFTKDNNNVGILDSFPVQNSILFKGKASVINGLFQFEFIVPKDINYTFGEGKISYYFANASKDGADYFDDFKIGGTAKNYVEDKISPIISISINDSNFVSGGLTDENPILLAKVSDESGINTVGNSIGHDIVAVLDNDYSNPFVLNEFYEANIDDYSSGSIKYPFNKLTVGKHTLNLKVWDIQNNSSEASIDFVVSDSKYLALSHVLNYPNPFSTSTDFYFEHNQTGSSLAVNVQVYTISGKIVKTISETLTNGGSLKSNTIHWDGKDEYGDKLARGVYFYKLSIQTDQGLKSEKIEKLVILN